MKKIIFFIVLALLFVIVPLSVYLVGQQQELRSKAAPTTTLALNPSTATKNRGDIFSFDIQIDTGGNRVAIAELHMIYDATKMEALSITNGPAAPLIAASGVVGSGTVSISVRAESTAKPITGTGTIAIVRFRALNATESPIQIKFDTTTFVSGIGESQPNVLTNTTPATVTIRGSNDQSTDSFELSSGSQNSNSVTPTPRLPSPTVASTQLTATLSAELSPTPDASQSATPSSTQAISIPSDEHGLTSKQPMFSGKAIPGSTVTIVIHSDPITAVVTADANGDWQYTPATPLADGSHTITATIQTPSGQTGSAAQDFTVSSDAVDPLTGNPLPTSGSILNTIIPLLFGALFLVSSIGVRYTTKL